MSQVTIDAQSEAPSRPLDVLGCLEQVLDGGNEPERCLAAQALGHVRGPQIAALLIPYLRDPDPDVRGEVARVLGEIGDPAAIPALLDNMRADPVGDIKVVYVEALHALQAQDAADLLRVLAVDRGHDHDVAWEDDGGDWDDWLDVQVAAIAALGHLGGGPQVEASAEAILAALFNPEEQDLWAVASRALVRLGPAGCARLSDILEDASALKRKQIAAALAGSACRDGNELLARLVRDQDATVRAAAIESAAALGMDSVSQTALRDPNPTVRATALALIGRPKRAQLMAALKDKSPQVRLAAYAAVDRVAQPIAGLGLTQQVEFSLRQGSPELIAALVSAAATAEPAAAADLIEDIVNHSATAPAVRRACLRALGRLPVRHAVKLLVQAASDDQQDIRLEAMAALGRLASGDDMRAQEARKAVDAAIRGDLVAVPADWEPPQDNVIQMTPKKGAQAAGDDGDATVRLDREGNVIEARPDADMPKPAPPPVREFHATSTLEAIMAVQPDAGTQDAEIEIEPSDLEYLERAHTRPGRRRVRLDADTPAHIDIRRLAARIAGGLGDASFVSALADAALAVDKPLADAAMDALDRLSRDGAYIAAAENQLTQQATATDRMLRCRALTALAAIATDGARATIHAALQENDGAVRAAALAATSRRADFDLDASAFCRDDERSVRLAAARIAARGPATRAVPLLIEIAMAEDGVHKEIAARLLVDQGAAGMQAVGRMVQSEDWRQRLVGLAMMTEILRYIRSDAGKATTSPVNSTE